MNKLKYYLGLDLGISSVGWAIMAEDPKTAKHTLYDFGVRLFDVPEVSKTKVSLATQRRGFRSTRRLIRRRKHRLTMLKRYLETINFLTFQQFDEQFALKSTNKLVKENNEWKTEAGYYNPYVVKVKGLESKLSKAELYAILLNYANRRGYADKFSFDEADSTDDKAESKKQKSKLDAAINTAEELVTKYGTISQAVLKSDKFTIFQNQKSKILWTQNNNKLVRVHGKLIDFPSFSKKHPDEAKKIKQISYRWLFSRQDYEDEVKTILKKQAEFYPELRSTNSARIMEIIFQTRDFEMGAKCRKCTEFMLANPANYQTQLKNCQSKSCSNYGVFWDMTGRCQFYPEEMRATKASIIFTIFYFINELSKIWIILESGKKDDLAFTVAEKRAVLHALLFKEWKSHTDAVKLIKNEIAETTTWKKAGNKDLFKLSIWKKDKDSGLTLKKPVLWNLCWDIPALQAELKKIALQANQIENWKSHLFDQIGITCARWITPAKRRQKLHEILNGFNIQLTEEQINQFPKQLKKADTEPGSTSFKYMAEAIAAYLEDGTAYANFQANFIKKQEENNKKLKLRSSPENSNSIFHRFSDPDMMTNPVVLRAISQTRKILKALHKKHGYFESIAVEVGKDLYSDEKTRRKISNQNILNFERKEKVIKILKENNFIINNPNVLAYRLWEQQKQTCLYCFKKIPLQDINPNAKKYEIDHIIPRSWSPDDSINNKVLVCKDCNQNKGQKIPYNYLRQTWKSFFINVQSCKNQLGKLKVSYLLSKTVDDAVLEFSTRNLNDSRYISKYIHNYIQKEIKTKRSEWPTKVFAVPGQLVSRLRRDWFFNSPWGLDKKVRNITPFHHAIDAIVLSQLKKQTDIALATDLVKLNSIKRNIQKYENETDNKSIYKFKLAISDKQDFEKMIDNKIKILRGKKFNVDAYEAQINAALNKKTQTNRHFYISELLTQVEARIPVRLKIIPCSNCYDSQEKKFIKDNCSECNLTGKLPKYNNILNQSEWEEEVKYLDKTNINLRYPHISRMVIYKVRGKITSSENLGFNNHQKNILFKLWLKNSKLSLEEAQQKPQLRNLSKVHFKRWTNVFAEKKDYMVNKFGNVVPLSVFYGIYLPKDSDEKAHFIRVIEAKKDKNLSQKYTNILLNNRLIEYFDKKLKKKIIKFYSGKTGVVLYLTPNLLTKSPSKSLNKQIFGDNVSKTDSINNILSNNWKIINIDLLGDIIS